MALSLCFNHLVLLTFQALLCMYLDRFKVQDSFIKWRARVVQSSGKGQNSKWRFTHYDIPRYLFNLGVVTCYLLFSCKFAECVYVNVFICWFMELIQGHPRQTFIDFCHSYCLKLWRPWMLLLAKSEGHKVKCYNLENMLKTLNNF